MTAERPRVLVVDDDALVRRVLGLVLRGGPWDVVVLDGGEAALQRLHAEAFDVVVTDIRMPKVGGLELARWLHEHRPATRVVLVTGFATDDDEHDIARLGARLQRKPFEGSTLVSLLKELLSGS
jgi:CheY-like chemotaxis protein